MSSSPFIASATRVDGFQRSSVLCRWQRCTPHADTLITDFLEDTDAFDRIYQTIVDPFLELAYEAEYAPYKKEKGNARNTLTLKGNRSVLRGGALMRASYSLMKPFGFNTLQGVVFTGNAGGFGETVANKILFKDLARL